MAQSNKWIKCELGDYASVFSGYAFKSSKFQDTGIPVIKIKNVRKGFIDLSDVQCVDEEYLSLDDKYHVKGGDILISLTGSHLTQPDSVVGRVALHRPAQGVCLLNQRAGKVIVKDPEKCDSRFLFYVISHEDNARSIALMAHGAANQANVSPTQVESLEIKLPPFIAQRKIASILSAYDDLIENNNRRIKILEEMAHAIYKEWFINFRFPGHEKVKMIKSKLGMIPEGWEYIPLNKVLDSFGGDWGEDNPTETETESVYIIRGADIRHLEKGLPSDVPLRYIKPESYRKKQLSAGDVIVENSVNAKSRSVGTSLLVTEGLLNRLKEKATFATFCRCFRPKKKEYGAFIHLHMQYLRKVHLIEYFQNVATNGIANFQSQMFLAKNMIPFPVNEDMQNDLLELLNQLTASTLADKNFNLIKTRDLLLPKLISGEVDVEKISINVNNYEGSL